MWDDSAIDWDPDPQREAEEIREERWAAFVAWCHGDRPKSNSEWSTLVHYVYLNMRGQEDWHMTAINQELRQFAVEEGWSGVLRALSQAMHEDEHQDRGTAA